MNLLFQAIYGMIFPKLVKVECFYLTMNNFLKKKISFFFPIAKENKHGKMETLIENKLDEYSRQLLIKLLRHFKILLNKNYRQSLEMNEIHYLFGELIIKLPKEYTTTNKKYEEIKNFNIRKKILYLLLELTEDKIYWNKMCALALTPSWID